jgi:branched-chain amino acid transport system ATP-binding protein
MVPAQGTIRFGGAELLGRQPHEISRTGIGYVPQGRRVFPSLSVDEHLRLVARRNGVAWTIARIWELFPPLAARRRSGAAELSGGEQQMLAIARALLLNPRLLVMDEPSEAWPHCRRAGRGVLPDVATGVGCSSSSRTRRRNVVADRIAIMVTGRIAAETTSAQILADEAAQRRYLGVSAQVDSPAAVPNDS